MYRNIVYNPFDEEVTLFTWRGDGERIVEKYPFKPYCYIEDQNGKDGVSIYNTKLKKVTFQNSIKRRDFGKTFKRTFYNLQAEQQFLIDKYRGQNSSDNFDVWPLRTFFLDIETLSENGFPSPTEANDPIILISVWDTLTNTMNTFGVGNNYYPNDPQVVFKFYETEEEMIKAFIRWWRKDFPDIVSGWYSQSFDIPYLCNRINKIYSDPKACDRLSPVGRTYKQVDARRRIGAVERTYNELWYISGITLLDYQELYIIFTREKKESYSLNAISEDELGQGKLAHDAISLSNMAKTDWQMFVEYNIQDVRLLVLLEDKLKYLQTCRNLAYRGLSPLIASMSTVLVVTGMAAQKALENNRIISTFENADMCSTFEGGFVKEPRRGLSKYLLYYDANSLYPNTIVSLNISNETKIGKFVKTDNNEYEVTTVHNKKYTLSEPMFKKLIDKEKLAISKSNILFSQKTKGMFPAIIEELYAKRVEIKKDLKKAKQKFSQLLPDSPEYQKVKFNIDFLDSRQLTIKILLNRIYGYFAEKHSPLYDMDMAYAVTSTGQACIKEASDIIDRYMAEQNIPESCVIYMDTDSCVFTIEPLLKKLNHPFLENNKISPCVHAEAAKIKTYININIKKWALETLNSLFCTYEFKQESISESAIFLAKKHYILNVRDDDGIEKDEFKYTGVEVVRTTTPKKIKVLIKDIIQKAMKTGNPFEVDKLLKQAYEEYKNLSIMDKTTTTGVNNYEKYANKAHGLKLALHTPRHVGCAIAYNHLLKEHGLENKYEAIHSGDKIKLMYVDSNKYGLHSIGFKNVFPEEFAEIFKIDDRTMFTKSLLMPVQRVFEALGWQIQNPCNEEKVNLLELFGS